MITIEMIAYKTKSGSEDEPWRCVVCDTLTRHTDEGIEPHLISVHDILNTRIKRHSDGTIFSQSGPHKIN